MINVANLFTGTILIIGGLMVGGVFGFILIIVGIAIGVRPK